MWKRLWNQAVGFEDNVSENLEHFEETVNKSFMVIRPQVKVYRKMMKMLLETGGKEFLVI